MLSMIDTLHSQLRRQEFIDISDVMGQINAYSISGVLGGLGAKPPPPTKKSNLDNENCDSTNTYSVLQV